LSNTLKLKELWRNSKQRSHTLFFALGTTTQRRISISNVFSIITRMFMTKFTRAVCTTPIIWGKCLQNWKFISIREHITENIYQFYQYWKLKYNYWYFKFSIMPNAGTAKFFKNGHMKWNAVKFADSIKRYVQLVKND